MLRALLGEEQCARQQFQGPARPLNIILARAIADHAGKSTSTSVAASVTTGDLSSREAAVLRLLGAGRTDREIATSLFISPRTASKHVGTILGTRGVGSRPEAAVFAIRHALV